MFEEDLYKQEILAQEPQEGDLFKNYEIKNWDFSPRIYKILAASAILNVLAFTVLAQTNILTMRGCESPFVGRVCEVLDMAYIGAKIYGTDREFVDVAYDRIDLGDAEITMIDVSGDTPPLSYPEGYFQIANPEQFAMQQAMAANPGGSGSYTPGIPSFTPSPSTGGSSMLNTTPKLPKPNRNAVKGDLPKSPFSVADDEEEEDNTVAQKNGGKNNSNSNTNTNTAAANDPTVNPTDPVAGFDINKRPMVDLGNRVIDLQEKNEVDLQAEFIVNAQGKLDKNGRLDQKTFRFIEAKSNNENMIAVVKESIEAINVAGYLQYLKDISGKDIKLLIKQDAENITAMVQSEMETDTRARNVKTAFDLAISLAKSKKTAPDADQNDKDDLLLLEGARVEVDGKKVIIHFNVPKTVAHPMIQRKLAEQAAENAKPNGNAGIRPSNNTAVR